MSSAGLKTTVLPHTSAGTIFQDGIAIGKFHGVITPTTPIGCRTLIWNLSRQLRRRRVAEEPSALAGHVVAHVDRFLDVPAGLGEHLPHLARHEVRELVLVLGEERAEAEEDLAALRRGHEPPALVRLLRGCDGSIDVLRRRPRERPDQVTVRGAATLERLVAGRVDPLAADEVLKCLRARRHRAECSRR